MVILVDSFFFLDSGLEIRFRLFCVFIVVLELVRVIEVFNGLGLKTEYFFFVYIVLET